MELFFLMKRQYPPYYKWTFRRLSELDKDGRYAKLISTFSDAVGDKSVWEGKTYSPTYINLSDPIVLYAERIAEQVAKMLRENGLTVLEEVCDLSARVVVNRVSMKRESERIGDMIRKLRALVAEDQQ